ncbi:protein PET100 homolog, mitochondrial-like [Gigantopelta aegis]|uniref:protein PET100 homolog, mitochondrial-like n=1 Tax=Gigantopelta aegis TaxID=1735272 RepID=UPI001B88A255|nr:protein PET100 homolog, mitochondrial-like [Gigantopelta aegis]
MGGWKLEVFKMGVYMAFPVSLFYYFNQPEFFEEWMMSKRSQFFPPKDPTVDEQLKAVIEELERRQEDKWKAMKKAQ